MAFTLGGFLSTPSARRATLHCEEDTTMPAISIHALREEGDVFGSYRWVIKSVISIHALREEGDQA